MHFHNHPEIQTIFPLFLQHITAPTAGWIYSLWPSEFCSYFHKPEPNEAWNNLFEDGVRCYFIKQAIPSTPDEREKIWHCDEGIGNSGRRTGNETRSWSALSSDTFQFIPSLYAEDIECRLNSFLNQHYIIMSFNRTNSIALFRGDSNTARLFFQRERVNQTLLPLFTSQYLKLNEKEIILNSQTWT